MPASRRGKAGSSEDGYYASWVEYGHIYRPKGQAIRGGMAKREAQRAAHIASGGITVPAHPYMRPAFVTKCEEAKEKLFDRLGTYLTLAMR